MDCFLILICSVTQCYETLESSTVYILKLMDCFLILICSVTHQCYGAGCSSVDSVPAFEEVGRRIDPSQWTQLQFGLFSVPTSGPQLVYQRPWYVLFCLWKSAYKRSLAAYRKE